MKKHFFTVFSGILLVPGLCAALQQPVVLITYYSVEGHTESMARAAARGARSAGNVEIRLKTIKETALSDLLDADAIIVGSPVYNANVAPAVQEFINQWPFAGSPLKNKVGAVIVTGGGISAGEELTQVNILHSMLMFGMLVVGGPEWESAFGASAVTLEEPFDVMGKTPVKDQFLTKAFSLGERVATLAILLHNQLRPAGNDARTRGQIPQGETPVKARIDLITLLTDRMEPMLRFYRDTVGLKTNRVTESYAEFDHDGIRFAVCERSILAETTGHASYLTPRAGQTFELAFRVPRRDDVDSEFQRLVRAGATPVKAPAKMPWGQYTAFLGDPDGNIFEIFADLPDSESTDK